MTTHEAMKRKTAGRGRRLAVFVMIMCGLAIYLFPHAADWFSIISHTRQIDRYHSVIDTLGDEDKRARFELAAQFNTNIPLGKLRDPFSTPISENSDKDYANMLAAADSDVIGRVRFDDVGIDLPIYSGTGEDAISRGAGHLEGSSLPIGGTSTHSVLTAHSGMPSARLFTPLHDAELGQHFWVEVLGERRWYRIEHIAVIDADDMSELQIVEGRDDVTLFKCTPIGVNSHRLLVRGERVVIPTSQEESVEITGPGFPWWAVSFMGVGIVLVIVLRPRLNDRS